MDFDFREEPSLERAVTFILNKNKPVYNWFYFKEGFSKEFVDYCFDKYSLSGKIADPFCGSGTTLLAAKERGLQAIGNDVSPLACFVSRVKTRNYDLESLKKEFSSLKLLNPEYKGEMPRQRLRKVKNPPIPIKHLFLKEKAKWMLRDVEKIAEGAKNDEPEVVQADSRTFELEAESVDAVITSPPYMNKIEYASVYKIELALFFQQQETQLRSFISDDARDGGSSSIAVENAYFKDMKKVMENLYKGLKKDGKAIIEVAGGCFPDRNIEADEKMAELAVDIGFECKEIVVARTIQCHRERTFKTGTVRESLVVLEKK